MYFCTNKNVFSLNGAPVGGAKGLSEIGVTTGHCTTPTVMHIVIFFFKIKEPCGINNLNFHWNANVYMI